MEKKRLIINSVDTIDVIQLNDLMYISSSGKYSVFVTSDKRKITSSSNIGQHFLNLPENQFVRIHNSYIVNLDYIHSIQKGENWNVILTDDSKLPVSRRKKDELMDKLKT